jgi:hypothetical protein
MDPGGLVLTVCVDNDRASIPVVEGIAEASADRATDTGVEREPNRPGTGALRGVGRVIG